MKILFDIQKQNSGSRNYSFTLLCKPFWIVKGKKKYIGNTIFITTLASHINAIISEYTKTQSLTGENLKMLNYYLSIQKTSVEELNNIFEEIN